MSKPAPIELQTAEIDQAEARAIRALAAGEARPDQQTLALSFIIKKLARADDLAYVPGDTHASAFLTGRAFVGSRLRMILSTPVVNFKEVKQ